MSLGLFFYVLAHNVGEAREGLLFQSASKWTIANNYLCTLSEIKYIAPLIKEYSYGYGSNIL